MARKPERILSRDHIFNQRFRFVAGPVTLAIVLAATSVAGGQRFQGLWVSAVLKPTHSLICELDDDEPSVRKAAFGELHALGVDAYDEILIARQSKVAEISMSCRRLLGELDMEAYFQNASPVLRRYLGRSYADRAKTIIRLGSLPIEEAAVALAVVAKMEPDEFLSRCAAVELVTSPQPIDGVVCHRVLVTLGHCQRVGATWLRAWCAHQQGQTMFEQAWQPLIDKVIRNELDAGQHAHLTLRLLTWYGDQLMRANKLGAAEELADQVVVLVPQGSSLLIEIADWFVKHRCYDQLAKLVSLHQESFESDARLQYRLADVCRDQDDREGADRHATRAVELLGQEPTTRIQAALHLQHAGLRYWASREFEAVVHNKHADVSVRAQACGLFAEMLFQDDRSQEASAVLQIAIDLEPEQASGAVVAMDATREQLQARKHFFTALHYFDLAKDEAALKELIAGIQLQPTNTDLLIALYQFPHPRTAWREDMRLLIDLALQDRAAQIADIRAEIAAGQTVSTLQRYELAKALNQFAWLVVQTEGDRALAEQYCREAIALSPRTAGFHHTLAQYHFGNADWRQAVASGQMAVTQQPANGHFRKSLARFRQAMAFAEATKVWR